MALINLGDDPNKALGANNAAGKPTTGNGTDPAAATSGPAKIDLSTPAAPANPGNPASISIDFSPKIATAEPTAVAKTDESASKSGAGLDQPKVISMEIKREDLKKEEDKKTGFLGGLFAKKEEKIQTKPSSAWGDALDKPRDLKVVSATSPSAPVAGPTVTSPTTATTTAKPAVTTVTPSAPVVSSPAPLSKSPAAPAVATGPAAADILKLATSATSATPASAKPDDKKPAEAKSEFFSSAALQEKSGTSKLVENITSQKAKLEQPKVEELLGKKSTILEKSIEQESLFKMKKKLRVAQFMSFFVTIVALAVNGYLYYQLSPGLNLLGLNYNFESNLRNDLFNLNQSLHSVQTDLNKYRYLSGQLYLNQFGYESTRFIDGVANLDSPDAGTDRTTIQSVIEEAKSRMPELLQGAKDNLTQPVVVETYRTRGEAATDPALIESEFQKDLRLAIDNEKSALQSANAENKQEVPADQLAFFDNALKLVGNTKLIINLNTYTVDAFKLEADEYEQSADPAQRLSFRTQIDNLLASTKVNLATINNLRNSRISWSEVIDAINRITNQVNSIHNSGVGAANASQFEYSSYVFDSKTGKISLNAKNVTSSGTNREVVTYLIEGFEASPEFKNITLRSFPLTKDQDASGSSQYTMVFSISMELEKGAFSKMNAPLVDLQNAQKVAQIKIPVKHK